MGNNLLGRIDPAEQKNVLSQKSSPVAGFLRPSTIEQ